MSGKSVTFSLDGSLRGLRYLPRGGEENRLPLNGNNAMGSSSVVVQDAGDHFGSFCPR